MPLVLLVLAFSAGCPQGTSHQRSIDIPKAAQNSPADELKTYLRDLAETGEKAADIDIAALDESVLAIMEADEEKGIALQKDLEDLKTTLGSDPVKVRVKAKEMLEKL